uniref:Uncharacterized protein n=1 Tax=Anopheles minimus TaxID=112268 RepID=A0A182WMN2_9DIPT
MAEKKLASYTRKRQSVLNMMKALEAFCETFDASASDEVPIRLELVEQCKTDYKEIMSKIEDLDLEPKGESMDKGLQEDAEFFTRFCKVVKPILI